RAEIKRAAKIEQLRTMTLRQAAEQFLVTDKIQSLKSDKHRGQRRSTLEAHAFPVFGEMPLREIDAALVLKALLPVWERTPETGTRLRGRIEKVFNWAKPLGLFAGDNPADRALLESHLPRKPKTKHHAAMPYADLPAFMATLRERESL